MDSTLAEGEEPLDPELTPLEHQQALVQAQACWAIMAFVMKWYWGEHKAAYHIGYYHIESNSGRYCHVTDRALTQEVPTELMVWPPQCEQINTHTGKVRSTRYLVKSWGSLTTTNLWYDREKESFDTHRERRDNIDWCNPQLHPSKDQSLLTDQHLYGTTLKRLYYITH